MICPSCGAGFTPEKRDQRYCTRACRRQKANREAYQRRLGRDPGLLDRAAAQALVWNRANPDRRMDIQAAYRHRQVVGDDAALVGVLMVCTRVRRKIRAEA